MPEIRLPVEEGILQGRRMSAHRYGTFKITQRAQPCAGVAPATVSLNCSCITAVRTPYTDRVHSKEPQCLTPTTIRSLWASRLISARTGRDSMPSVAFLPSN